jgi:hypothetical protein
MFDGTLAWLKDHALILNIITTGGIVAFAIVPLLKRPALLRDHPAAWHAFGFWILQWITLLIVYILFPVLTRRDLAPLLLLLIDIQSIMALGFFKAFLDGRLYRPFPVMIGLAVIAGIFAGLDLGLGYHVINDPPGSERRLWWIAGSEMLSATSLVLLGGVFIVRLGRAALWMLVATSIYGFLQRPVYSNTFIYLTTDETPFLALALWKVIIGSLFYLYFLAPLSTYEPVKLPATQDPVVAYLQRWQGKVLTILGALSLIVIAELISKLR